MMLSGAPCWPPAGIPLMGPNVTVVQWLAVASKQEGCEFDSRPENVRSFGNTELETLN